MGRLLILFVLALSGSACSRNPEAPAAKILYTEFQDKAIAMNEMFQADISGDGNHDFRFSTVLIGDPLARTDFHQYYFLTLGGTKLPVTPQEETPLLAKGARIGGDEFRDSIWNYANVILAQKVIRDSLPPYWTGNWKEASHGYLALRVIREGLNYYGWVEISVDQAGEKVILHRAALNQEPEMDIMAGS